MYIIRKGNTYNKIYSTLPKNTTNIVGSALSIIVCVAVIQIDSPSVRRGSLILSTGPKVTLTNFMCDRSDSCKRSFTSSIPIFGIVSRIIIYIFLTNHCLFKVEYVSSYIKNINN